MICGRSLFCTQLSRAWRAHHASSSSSLLRSILFLSSLNLFFFTYLANHLFFPHLTTCWHACSMCRCCLFLSLFFSLIFALTCHTVEKRTTSNFSSHHSLIVFFIREWKSRLNLPAKDTRVKTEVCDFLLLCRISSTPDSKHDSQCRTSH